MGLDPRLVVPAASDLLHYLWAIRVEPRRAPQLPMRSAEARAWSYFVHSPKARRLSLPCLSENILCERVSHPRFYIPRPAPTVGVPVPPSESQAIGKE